MAAMNAMDATVCPFSPGRKIRRRTPKIMS